VLSDCRVSVLGGRGVGGGRDSLIKKVGGDSTHRLTWGYKSRILVHLGCS